jgi:glycosyltransferase involved in cell wall biosynthesis
MKYSIITPTYQRLEGLRRAIDSVRVQSHTDWEMIIVNDNPGDDTKYLVRAYADPRIIFIEQEKNSGANAARNRGLDAVNADSDRVLFLDDDDYLTPDALATIKQLIIQTSSPWLVTARGTNTDTPTTKTTTNTHTYRYLRDYLVTRRFRGDATHAIATGYIRGTLARLRFPTAIRQGEEWLFYAALGRMTSFYYEPVVTTLTEGYTTTGLNNRRRGLSLQLRTIPSLVHEGRSRRLSSQPLFWWYILMRIVRAFIKQT